MNEPVYRALREQVAAVELRSPWLWTTLLTGARTRAPNAPLSPHTFSDHYWPAILKRAGVKHRPLYQCRHTFATLLLRNGAEWQYVADQMGHADLQMLTKIYWQWRQGSTPKPERDILAEALGD
jgi:integrase